MSDFVRLSDVTTGTYVQWMHENTPWSLSRWGDGEIRSLLTEDDACWGRLKRLSGAWAKGRTNKSGHSFPYQMGEDMRTLLRGRPKHRLAIAGRFASVRRKSHEVGLGKWLKEWLVKNKLDDLTWDPCDLIVYSLIKQKFRSFLAAMRARRVVVVGPAHLKKLKVFKVAGFVETPRRDAYRSYAALFKSTAELLHKKEPTVVSISMGPAAPLLVESLHNFDDGRHTILDLGSIWDPFVGESSRSYMRRPALKAYVAELVGGS